MIEVFIKVLFCYYLGILIIFNGKEEEVILCQLGKNHSNHTVGYAGALPVVIPDIATKFLS